MSILPSQNLVGSTSSSSSSELLPIISPNSNHGDCSHSSPSPCSSNPSQHHTTSTSTRALRSLRISDSDNYSESMASAADSSSRSFKEVSMPMRQRGRSSMSYQHVGEYSGQETAVRVAPESAQNQGNSSGITVSQNSHHDAASTSAQETTKHLAARKTQRVSGNHLLNFHYDPIFRPQPRVPPARRQHKRKPYNKDLFLQANYKFVVLDTGNYTPELMDPDKMLQWEDIVCVKYSTPFSVHCPICLGDPLCPQITSCGHIFCFPCILQYFLMDKDDHRGESWKRCPLCFMMISSKDLYTIYIENVKQHSVGDIIEFILLTRQKDSYNLSLKNIEGVSTNGEVLHSFSKFILTSDTDISVREAISDLDNWLAKADSGLVDDLEKLPYVCAAMEQLEQRKRYWNKYRVPVINKTRPSSILTGSPPTANANMVHSARKYVRGTDSLPSNDKLTWLRKSPPDKLTEKFFVAKAADIVEQAEDNDQSSYDENKSTWTDDMGERNDRDSYCFYQAADGQHIILHPLNMKCLLHHYGSYNRLPGRISGRILQLETVTQSEAIRKRYRYLSHFSLTTVFQLCEIDLREAVPVDALSPFMDEIKNRENQRKRLARKERQEKIKAEAVGLDLVPIPYDIVALPSFDGSPTFSLNDFEALGSSNVGTSSPSDFGERQLFSSVARLGFAAGHDSPALKNEEPQSLPQIDVPGPTSAGTLSFASITSRTKPDEDPDKSRLTESGKKGRKPSRVLLSTAGGRRY